MFSAGPLPNLVVSRVTYVSPRSLASRGRGDLRLPDELYLSYHFGGPACGYRRLRGDVSLLLMAASHPDEVSPLLGPPGLGPVGPLYHLTRTPNHRCRALP